MTQCTCEPLADASRREFFVHTMAAAAVGVVSTTGVSAPAAAVTALSVDKRKFMEEAMRLAIESADKGWGGPFGAVITKYGEIIGRG